MTIGSFVEGDRASKSELSGTPDEGRAKKEENIMKEKSPLMNRGFCRRRFLMSGAALVAASALEFPRRACAETDLSDPEPFIYDGSTDPYPIPWLDKNDSHNQPAGSNLEPSHIYHFKGKIARCADFSGMGTDNKGNRLAFGNPTTDNSFMQGEYFTGRTTHSGNGNASDEGLHSESSS
jgi:hypothetical protein